MHAIDLWTALRYPYAFGNLRRGWLLPAATLAAAQLLAVVLAFYLPKDVLLTLPAKLPVVAGFKITLPAVSQFLILIVLNLLLCGFLWTMTGQLQTQGKQAPLLQWRNELGHYLWRGFKLFIMVSLFAMAMAFATQWLETHLPLVPMLVMGLLTILYTLAGFALLVLIVESSTVYRFIDLFRIYRPFACFRDYFLPWVVACMFTILLLGLYILALGVVGMIYNAVLFGGFQQFFDILVLPFGMVPMMISTWHLLNQPFLPEAEEPAAQEP